MMKYIENPKALSSISLLLKVPPSSPHTLIFLFLLSISTTYSR